MKPTLLACLSTMIACAPTTRPPPPAPTPAAAPPPTAAWAPNVANPKPRARDLGIPFNGHPGPLNAITDVAGVEVGMTTLIEGSGKLVRGEGPVRTGVTAILPRGRSADPVYAAYHSINGNGEMTGTAWVDEGGFLEGPVMITNTHSVGVVRDATIAWLVRNGLTFQEWSMPVVAETADVGLNDMNGFHVKPEHAWQALDGARPGPVPEGNVGGGTGMICYEFKCGTGTASRKLADRFGAYTVGVLVQANHSVRFHLTVAGVPVGREITEHAPFTDGVDFANDRGSIIIVVATDAPLLPHQLERIARRAAFGLARTGSVAEDGSGDLVIAFSTANPGAARKVERLEDLKRAGVQVTTLPNGQISPLFDATVDATEEAIINALIAGESMKGADDLEIVAIPHQRLAEVLAKYGRLRPPAPR